MKILFHLEAGKAYGYGYLSRDLTLIKILNKFGVKADSSIKKDKDK